MCAPGKKKTSAAGMLLIGGEGPERRRVESLLLECELIVAADSGLDLADRLGLKPDVVVGDMDSLSDRRKLDDFSADKVHLFPCDKDETDTEIGLRYFCERGFERVFLVGGGEGRLDHLLGILALFERDYRCPAFACRKGNQRVIRDSESNSGRAGLGANLTVADDYPLVAG